VVEMFPAPDQLWVAGANGRHAAEFLVQMQHHAPREEHR
jgi:hypothetical protein